MLKDTPVKNVPGDLRRRWMADDYFDLIIWYEPDDTVHGFQLCYDKLGCEGAISWTRTRGFSHCRIDAGDADPLANRTPILVTGDVLPIERIRHEFLTRSEKLPAA